MLLFFQHLNASATILAIAACLAPILNILQIPAAQLSRKSGIAGSFSPVGLPAVSWWSG